MRTLKVIGSLTEQTLSGALVRTINKGGSRTVDDLLLLASIFRSPEAWKPIGSANWSTADGFNLCTKDGFLFNVKE